MGCWLTVIFTYFSASAPSTYIHACNWHSSHQFPFTPISLFIISQRVTNKLNKLGLLCHSVNVQRRLLVLTLSRTVPLWMFHQFAHNSRWRQNMHWALQAVLVLCRCSSTQNRSDSWWKTLLQIHSWWTIPRVTTIGQVSLQSTGMDAVHVAGQWTVTVDFAVYAQMHAR